MKIRSLIKSTALAAAALAASSAFAFPQFTINENAIPGTSGKDPIVSDRVIYDYNAKIYQNVNGDLGGTGDTFLERGFFTVTGFSSPGGVVDSSLQTGNSSGGYKLYGIFEVHGEADFANGTDLNGGVKAKFTDMTITWYVDNDKNTTLGLTGTEGSIAATRTGTISDDFAIATMTLRPGQGEALVFNGLAKGNYHTILDVVYDTSNLKPGQKYFDIPADFYKVIDFSGETNTITGLTTTGKSTATVNGGGTINFTPSVVPEPTSISLLGAGMLGMWVSRRRKAKKA